MSRRKIIQFGGGNCTLCGAKNTNRTTCPRNPNSKSKNKHKEGSRAPAAAPPLQAD